MASGERNARWLPVAAGVLVALGCAPRVAQYLHYRALFHDEAVLAAHVLERSPWQLFLPYGDSMAPGGFMLAVRAVVALGGVNEFAARFVPFLGGLIALALVYPVGRRYVSSTGALTALAFVAVNRPLIEFGNYVRPYSTDATIALALLGCALWLKSGVVTWARAGAFGIVAAIAVWCSFPAVFVIAGLGVVHGVEAIIRRDRKRICILAVAFGLPALSFLTFYLLSLRPIAGDSRTMDLMYEYYDYAGAFMPFPPDSLGDLRWFRFHFFRVFAFPGGLTMVGLAGFTALVGTISLARRAPQSLLFLLAPIAMVLIASSLERYPFWQRTILFLAPILLLLVGEGIAFMFEKLPGRSRIVAVLLAVMLGLIPAARAARITLHPITHHELNTVLDHAAAQWREGDAMLVHWESSDALIFLRWRYAFADEDLVVAWNEPMADADRVAFIEAHLDELRERGRVWVPVTYDAPHFVETWLSTLDRYGTRLDEMEAPGALVVLYDFSSKPFRRRTEINLSP